LSLQNVIPFGNPAGQGFVEDGHNPAYIACGTVVAGGGKDNTAVNAEAMMTAQKKFPRLNLKRLWDTIENLEVPNGKSQKKFHTAFVTKFKGLLFYFQFRISKVNKGGVKVLYEFIKNQKKIDIRNGGKLHVHDNWYMKFLPSLGVSQVDGAMLIL